MLALALVVLVLPGCASKAPPPTTKELPIGLVVSLTGTAAAMMVNVRDTGLLEVERINAGGGIKVGNERYLIKLIIEDDRWSAEGGRAAIEKLVNSDKVKYVVGPFSSSATIATEPVQEPNKVLQLTGGVAVKIINPQLTYKFRHMPTPSEQAVPFMTWVAKAHPEVKRLAIIGENNEFGWSNAANFVYAAKVAGQEVVAKEFHAVGEVDFYSVLTRMLAKDPQGLMINEGSAESHGLITKQAKELGYKGLILSPTPPPLGELEKIAGPGAAEGQIWVAAFNTGTAAIDDFVKRWNAAYGGKPFDPIAYTTWNVFDILKQAIEKAQSLDTTAVRDVMDSGMEFEIKEGTARFGGKARYGIAHQLLTPTTIMQIEGGKLVFRGISPGEEPPPLQ